MRTSAFENQTMIYASSVIQVKNGHEAEEMFIMWNSRWLLIQVFFFSPLRSSHCAVKVEKEKKVWTPFQITIKTDRAFVEEPASTLFLSAAPRFVLVCPVELKPPLMWRQSVLQSRTCTLEAAQWWGGSHTEPLNLDSLHSHFKERGIHVFRSSHWCGCVDSSGLRDCVCKWSPDWRTLTACSTQRLTSCK